jgi:putative membrane protein
MAADFAWPPASRHTGRNPEEIEMMQGLGGWGGGGYGYFGMLPMLLFWILIIAGIILFVRWSMTGGTSGQDGAGESSLDLLKKRYARGEIGKEEFEAKRREIA